MSIAQSATWARAAAEFIEIEAERALARTQGLDPATLHFREWLDLHVPERAEHVMSLIRQMRGGRDNDPRFGSRMRGEGEFAELIRQRFALACRKFGITRGRDIVLDSAHFAAPRAASAQAELF